MTSLAAKVISVAATMVTIPMTSAYLGPERFGVWMVLGTLTALLVFADFGLGNGLLNAVATGLGRDDPQAIRRAVSSAVAMLAVVGALFAVVSISILAYADPSILFGVMDPLVTRELNSALLVFIACFVMSLQAGVVQRTLAGLQEGMVVGWLMIIGNTLGMVAVLAAVRFEGSVPVLLSGYLGVPAITMLLGGWGWLRLQHNAVLPAFTAVDRSTAVELLRLGGMFFALQVSAAFAFSTDAILGAYFFSAANIGDFVVAAKLFGLVTVCVSVLVSPLWPAYTEALQRQDLGWIRTTLWRTSLFSLSISILAAVTLTALFDWVCRVWLGRELSVELSAVLGFGLLAVVLSAGASVSMLLNGASVVREQVAISIVFGSACLLTKAVLAPRLGLSALPWVTALTYVLCVLVPYALLLPPLMRRLAARTPG